LVLENFKGGFFVIIQNEYVEVELPEWFYKLIDTGKKIRTSDQTICLKSICNDLFSKKIVGLSSYTTIKIIDHIFKYESFCIDTFEEISKETKVSKATVKRIISILVKKNILKRKYTLFKRMILTINSKYIEKN
jgi:hypothetical protein